MLKNRKVAFTTVIDIATIKHSAKIARQNTAIFYCQLLLFYPYKPLKLRNKYTIITLVLL